MAILVCGSVAFDTIMVFPDRFRNHILPDQLHMLNVSFLAPEMRRELGGCAGNIAYNLRLLGESPLVMATVGDDFAPYAEKMDRLGLSRQYVQPVRGTYTAQAFITTDLEDNQITAFHPGAMGFSHLNHVAHTEGVTLGIVSPDGRDGMMQHAEEFAAACVPFIFDPGQGLPLFNGEELMHFIGLADYVTVNDYEGKVIEERCQMSLEALAERVKAVVVTMGAAGSVILTEGRRIEIPAARPEGVVDPTGCGDAYRGGLLYGLAHGLDWETTGRLGALLGAIKIGHRGPQNHVITREGLMAAFKEQFGYSISL